MHAFFLNGLLLDSSSSAKAYTDAAFTLGEGAFETMLVRAGTVLHLDRHQSRLAKGLDYLGMDDIAWDAVFGCIRQFPSFDPDREMILRVQVSRGPLTGGFGSSADGEPSVLVRISEAPERPTSVTAAIIDWPRRAQGGLSTEFKCLGYANENYARRMARRAGADMALMVGLSGQVACADVANLFLITDGRLITPSAADGALKGTVRDCLIGLAAELGLDVQEDEVSRELVRTADAVFVTNAFLGACLIDKVIGVRTYATSDDNSRFVSKISEMLLDAGRFGHGID